jgi:hypothetical protein
MSFAANMLTSDSTAGPVGQPLRPFHRRDALPRGTLMTVPTVVIMQKKKNTASNGFPEHCIDELLELVPGAESTSQSRSELVIALQFAQMFYEGERDEEEREQPSSKQIAQLEKSIEKTCVLLRRIRRYDDFRNTGFVTQPIGRGIVAVGLAQELPRNPSISDGELVFPSRVDGKVATMNIEPLLRATLLRARWRKPGRGGPKSLAKEAVVFTQRDTSVGIPS